MPQRIHSNPGYFQMETVQPESPVSAKARAVTTLFRWPCVPARFLTATASARYIGQVVVVSNPPQTERGRRLQQPHASTSTCRTQEGGGTSQESSDASRASIYLHVLSSLLEPPPPLERTASSCLPSSPPHLPLPVPTPAPPPLVPQLPLQSNSSAGCCHSAAPH